MEPPPLIGNISADDLLISAQSSLVEDCLLPEILPIVSSSTHPNASAADRFQTTMTSFFELLEPILYHVELRGLIYRKF